MEVMGLIDSFGNRCSRVVATPGLLRLNNLTVIHDSGASDPVKLDAREVPLQELANDVIIARGLLIFAVSPATQYSSILLPGDIDMLIRLGFDIQFEIPSPVAMVALFHVHQNRRADLREPDEPQITPTVPIHEFQDSFGNVCSRFVAPAGRLQLYNSTLIEDSGEPDPVSPQA